MTTHPLDQVLSLLPKMKKADLVKVKAVIESLVGRFTTAHTVTSEVWLDALCQVTGSKKIPIENLGTEWWVKTFPSLAMGAEAYVDEICKKQDIEIGSYKAGVRRWFVALLGDELVAQGVPVSIKSLATNLERLPEVVDKAFPDYVHSGLSHLFLSPLTGKNNASE